MNKIFSIAFVYVCLQACTGKQNNIGEVDGYTPIYSTKAEAEKITALPPQAIVNGGKIATLNKFLFQVEEGKGIHIIDYANATTPIKKGFIQVPLCHELTVKGNFIYTNNMADLVVLDVSAGNTVSVTSRITNAFPDLAVQYPPVQNAWFECPDASKGVVVAWQSKKLNNPKCKTAQ
jgi:hypothetical protein